MFLNITFVKRLITVERMYTEVYFYINYNYKLYLLFFFTKGILMWLVQTVFGLNVDYIQFLKFVYDCSAQ